MVGGALPVESTSQTIRANGHGTKTGVPPSIPTIAGGGDTTIPFPGRSPKQPLPGIGLHDPLHGRQAYPELNLFHQGVSQISPREGLFLRRSLPKRRQTCDIPPPPPIVERLRRGKREGGEEPVSRHQVHSRDEI